MIFWGTVMGAVAIIMLLVGGEDALSGLQSLTILVAAPFVVIMVFLCIAFMRDLNHDPVILRERKGLEVMEQAIDHGTDKHGEDFYLHVQAFPTTRARQRATGEGTGPTYAEVYGVQDPFSTGETPAVPSDPEEARARARSVPKDDDPSGTEVVDTGPGARAEAAGRPSADRE